jgi:hypothetical protein
METDHLMIAQDMPMGRRYCAIETVQYANSVDLSKSSLPEISDRPRRYSGEAGEMPALPDTIPGTRSDQEVAANGTSRAATRLIQA